MQFITERNLISAPIRGCFPMNASLPSVGPDLVLSSPVCELQYSGLVSACMCTTPGCNADPSLATLPRITSRQQNSNSSLASQPRTRTGRQRRLQCWSCGSLFNRDRARCERFTKDREDQVMSCGEGEACMLYTWMKSKSEIGNHHHLYHLLCMGWNNNECFRIL